MLVPLLATKPAVRPFTDSSYLLALSPLAPAGVRRELISYLVREDCFTLLLASVIGFSFFKIAVVYITMAVLLMSVWLTTRVLSFPYALYPVYI